VTLGQQIFEAGLLDYLQVAILERLEIDSRRRAIRLKGTRYLSTVGLIKALGGSFIDC
jgi:outer membrane protein TolC